MSTNSAMSPPRAYPERRACSAFTLLELLVVLGIIAVLIGLLFPVIAQVRQAERSVTCLGNLRQVGIALRLYASDHSGRFPDPSAGGGPWEQTLITYTQTMEVFRCPADHEMYPAVGSSYDWRDTGNIQTTAAGRALGDVRPAAVLAFDALPSWHRKGTINVLRADGSSLTMDQEECFADLDAPTRY